MSVLLTVWPEGNFSYGKVIMIMKSLVSDTTIFYFVLASNFLIPTIVCRVEVFRQFSTIVLNTGIFFCLSIQ